MKLRFELQFQKLIEKPILEFYKHKNISHCFDQDSQYLKTAYNEIEDISQNGGGIDKIKLNNILNT